MKWLMVSELHSSLKAFLQGNAIAQGTPAPVLWLQHLLKKGDHVTLMCRFSPDRLCGELKNNQNLHLVTIPDYLSWKRILGHFRYKKMIREQILREKPDVVYATGYFSFSAFPALKKYDIPYFTRFYGVKTQYFFTPRMWFSRYIIKMLGEVSAMKRYKSGIIITNDGTQGNMVCEKLGIPKNKLLFIRNGVDKNHLAQIVAEKDKVAVCRKYDLPEDCFLLSSVTRLAGWKRVDLVIKGMEQLRKCCDENLRKKIHLVIGGDGSRRKNLEMLARQSGVADQIHFVGNLNRDEAMRLLCASDATAMFYEMTNVGNVMLECLQLGKVIITRAIGDTEEVIQDNINGFVCPQDENEVPRAFALKLVELMKSPRLAEKIASEAFNWAENHLVDWDTRMEREYQWIALQKDLSGH